ncbi:MAG: 4-hydroxybenzoyl-CoA reductase subunit beta [Burkholderiales bacterium]|jgi:4-hydroxybenzoyl-CoA reductase subunit beta|nr:4-hydroxybenzoyl-CoA reductase subunit beta [Burkholderiales bacterium]
MERLAEFALLRPASLTDAVRLLMANPHGRILAGGTDLVPNLRRGIGAPTLLVDLSAIRGLDTIEDADGGIRIGACATVAALAKHPEIAARCAAVAEAAKTVAGPGHRAVATLGGNLCLDTRCVFYNQAEWWRRGNDYCLKHRGSVCHVAPQGERCHAAFSGDLAPALIALSAEAEIASATGTRIVPLETLYRDDGASHLTLAPWEILAAVRIPAAPGVRSGYRKARARGAIDFPLAGVAVALSVAEGRLASLRVAVTGTNSRPFVVEGTADFVGSAPDEETAAKLGKLVEKQVRPMRTTATSSHYRRQVAVVLARRLALALAAG